MTQEEKQLLLKDLCARLPYGVRVRYHWDDDGKYQPLRNNEEDLPLCDINTNNFNLCYHLENAKPYLRPMSSMSEKEKKAFNKFICIDEDAWLEKENGCVNQAKIMSGGIDWLLEHHFDFRGLISKGIALEAPKDMYKTE